VTATQIIEEIKRLDPEQQLGVIRFAYQLDAERRLLETNYPVWQSE
jgi:hypothetical protein